MLADVWLAGGFVWTDRDVVAGVLVAAAQAFEEDEGPLRRFLSKVGRAGEGRVASAVHLMAQGRAASLTSEDLKLVAAEVDKLRTRVADLEVRVLVPAFGLGAEKMRGAVRK